MSDFRSSPSVRPGAISEFRRRRRNRLDLICEALESRQLLSMTMLATGPSPPSVQPNITFLRTVSNPVPTSLTPSQIRDAYGFDPGSQTGAGVTIAIVDAYNDPTIQSDLATFDSQYMPGLPAANLTVAIPQGTPRTDPGWALEISLDVEWAHAIAPGAKIVLVEAQTNSISNLLNAVDYAARPTNLVGGAGAQVVSMSWGGSEFPSELGYDGHFNVPGVTFLASAGDRAGAEWPAVSPNVIGVGGTTLQLNSDYTINSETAWSSSGGGFSRYEPPPSYQSGLNGGRGYSQRATPDVAYDADPNTGVAVYDSTSYSGLSGWFQVGGTSAAPRSGPACSRSRTKDGPQGRFRACRR